MRRLFRPVPPPSYRGRALDELKLIGEVIRYQADAIRFAVEVGIPSRATIAEQWTVRDDIRK